MPIKRSTEAPERVTNAKERGQMLRHLISRTHKSVPTFAAEVGLPRSTMSALLNGQNDPDDALPATATAIVHGLGMSDEDVAEALALSPAGKQRWRTARAGLAPEWNTPERREYRLVTPMMGEVVLPTNAIIALGPDTDFGIQVVRLPSGELFAMWAGASANAAGQVMGQLLHVDFATVL